MNATSGFGAQLMPILISLAYGITQLDVKFEIKSHDKYCEFGADHYLCNIYVMQNNEPEAFIGLTSLSYQHVHD